MKLQKKIAMSAGGAVLLACLTLGGLATANAATLTPSASTAATAATAKIAAVKKTASVPVPQSPGGAVQFPDWVKTLSSAQKQALLADLETKLAKYELLEKQGAAGAQAAVEKLSYSEGIVKAALGK